MVTKAVFCAIKDTSYSPSRPLAVVCLNTKNSDSKFPQNLYLWLKISNHLGMLCNKSKKPECHNVEIRPQWFNSLSPHTPIILLCLAENMLVSKSIIMTYVYKYTYV